MKMSPQDKKLDQMLRSSTLVAGGFMGTDPRSVFEVIEADAAVLDKYGLNAAMVARRMQELTNQAQRGLGTWIDVNGGRLRVMSEEYKGLLVCPWGHPGRYDKRITIVECPEKGQTLTWSDLNIHLIEAHGFFEGKGSAFRIEPELAAAILFHKDPSAEP
jgi:hypothetical protein